MDVVRVKTLANFSAEIAPFLQNSRVQSTNTNRTRHVCTFQLHNVETLGTPARNLCNKGRT